MNKDFSNKDCCLNCQGFVFWDGDYCCFPNFKIHQYGYSNGIWMNEDIDNTMKTPETCEDYEKITYPSILNEYLAEYKKFKEYQEMINNYNKFIK